MIARWSEKEKVVDLARFSRVPCSAARLRLPAEALRILIELGRYADRDGLCRPGLPLLAKRTGIARRNLHRNFRRLEEAGLLHDNGNGTFTLIYEDPVERLDPVTERLNPETERLNPETERLNPETHIKMNSPKNIPLNTSGAVAPDDPVKQLWDRGLAILGQGQRSLLGKLRKRHGDVVVLEAIVATETECPSDPPAFLVACCQRRHLNGRSSRQTPVELLYEGAWRAAEQSEREQADRSARGEVVVPLLDRSRSG
jgi:hypothetical protein